MIFNRFKEKAKDKLMKKIESKLEELKSSCPALKKLNITDNFHMLWKPQHRRGLILKAYKLLEEYAREKLHNSKGKGKEDERDKIIKELERTLDKIRDVAKFLKIKDYKKLDDKLRKEILPRVASKKEQNFYDAFTR